MVTILAAASSAAIAATVTAALVRGRRGSRRRRWPSSWGRPPGVDVTPAQFWLTSIGAGLVTYLLVAGLTRLPVVAAMPALVVSTVPKSYFSRRAARRLEAVQQAWPDGLRDLVSSVRSGASLPSAIDDLARFGPQPLRSAFHAFPVYARSLGVVPALEMVKSDLADPTSDRVIEVLILAYQRDGVVVPEILTDLAEATTRDLWTLEQIHTEALEQKINARVVFVLPWLVLVAMTSRSGAFREFYSSSAGILVALLGAVLSLVGVFVASRLGAQPAEPRVLVAQRIAE